MDTDSEGKRVNYFKYIFEATILAFYPTRQNLPEDRYP